MPATNVDVNLNNIGRDHNSVVDFWNNNNPSNTLVIHSHGMQDPAANPDVAQALAAAGKNYAFIVPFDRALNNAGFIHQPDSAQPFVTAFIEHAADFRADNAPWLKVYPYLVPIAGLDNVLDSLSALQTCDILKLKDIEPWPAEQCFYLDELLRARHPVQNQTLYEVYDSFLLLTCRSSTALHEIGMGGAAATYPNGLYPQSNDPALHIV